MKFHGIGGQSLRRLISGMMGFVATAFVGKRRMETLRGKESTAGTTIRVKLDSSDNKASRIAFL